MEVPEILACRKKVLLLPDSDPWMVDNFFGEEFAIRDSAEASHLPKIGSGRLIKVVQG